MTQYCVLYLKDRKELRTPWFRSYARAREALKLMQTRYGKRNAILYVD